MVAISTALSAASTSAAISSHRTLQISGCDISSYVPAFPENQAIIAPHKDAPPTHIGLTFGTQNYTCSSTGTYTSIGALAELVDAVLHCKRVFLSDNPGATVHLLDRVQRLDRRHHRTLHLANSPEILAQHYVVHNPAPGGTGLNPKRDFTSSGQYKGNPKAFITDEIKGTLPSPNNATTDVAWLTVHAVEGDIAGVVIRYDTAGGQPPSSIRSISAVVDERCRM